MAFCQILWPRAAIGKGRPRAGVIAGRARIFTPAKTRAAEADLALFARDAMAGREPFDAPLTVVIEAHYLPPASWSAKKRAAAIGKPKVTKPDLDNVAKLLDALNGIVWRDDAQIAEMHIAKRYGERDHTLITVAAAERAPAAPQPAGALQ